MDWGVYSYIIFGLVMYTTRLPLTTLVKPLESDNHPETNEPTDVDMLTKIIKSNKVTDNLPKTNESTDAEMVTKNITHNEDDHPETNEPTDEEDIVTKILASNKGIAQILHQGDIAVHVGRSTSKCNNCKWDTSYNGRVSVPYVVSSDYNSRHLALITAAMQEYETLTCVDFVPRTNEKNAININNGNGCWSYIGRAGGIQEVSLSNRSCMSKGIIQHEINHALGFVHEHVRSDRDQYVDVVMKNIAPDAVDNFAIEVTDNLGLPYDYKSVMHYGRNAFSISPQLPTLITKPDPNIPIGQRDGLTNLDIAKINKFYKCDICSTLLSDTNGTLFSPYYSSAYPNNVNCVWLIRIPSKQVAVQFMEFNLQDSQNCVSNYVKIYDGATRSDPVLLDKACGSPLLPPIISTSNLMLLEFVTNAGQKLSGFKATYSTVSCGGTYISQSNNFSSPGYPAEYPPSTTCSWSIYAPVGSKIVLSINDIDLEYGLRCMFDSLIIYDGYKTTSPILKRACGNSSVAKQVSSGRSMLLVFSSDISVQMKGFQASYTLKSAN
ncbi:uncharacterized protein LOC100158314 [Xenopus laevis]|uniref:Metalloendopeptidase n=1 Tax=Xenopus laevis TaxID=8355 RepID=B1H1V3_XENLA|nr:Embryonic protein UVS.2-like [Xenopus laevis]AAI60750.1 LOC100158314 protein [Xenopus laevis]